MRVAGVVLAALAVLASGGGASAQTGMPDARQMSGLPLPVPEMTPGTVSVRVVRGSMTNPIAGQTVELIVAGETKTAVTDATGRATFENVKIGATASARAVVGSETLSSQEFQIPSQGGLRMILAATDANAPKEAAAAPAAPAQPGTLSLGSQSRIHVELSEEAAEIYYLMEIVNAAQTPVEPQTPFALQLPDGATGSSILEGSSPNATAAGRQVTVRGPFQPGTTSVQVAYRLPYSGGRTEFSQAFPAAFTQPTISIVKKLPGVSLNSAAFQDTREIVNNGQPLLVAHAKATPANTPLDVRIDGVPTHPAWPRVLALALAAIILGGGAWLTATAGRRVAAKTAAARQLEARREKLFAELASLEQRRRAASIPEGQYSRRRREIIADLERVYGDLDQGTAA